MQIEFLEQLINQVWYEYDNIMFYYTTVTGNEYTKCLTVPYYCSRQRHFLFNSFEN